MDRAATDRVTEGFVDQGEVARFDALAATWWDESGPMRVLHRFNPVRVAYIRDALCRRFGRDPRAPFPLDGLTICDVGCGGGVLSEPLARLGARVTGLDPAAQNIAVARAHAEVGRRSGRLSRCDHRGGGRCRRALRCRADHGGGGARVGHAGLRAHRRRGREAGRFAVRRHPQPDAALLRAGHRRSRIRAGLAAEGHHDWEKFVTPDELARAIRAGGLDVTDTVGVVYNPLTDGWRTGRDTAVNYMVAAERPA